MIIFLVDLYKNLDRAVTNKNSMMKLYVLNWQRIKEKNGYGE